MLQDDVEMIVQRALAGDVAPHPGAARPGHEPPEDLTRLLDMIQVHWTPVAASVAQECVNERLYQTLVVLPGEEVRHLHGQAAPLHGEADVQVSPDREGGRAVRFECCQAPVRVLL